MVSAATQNQLLVGDFALSQLRIQVVVREALLNSKMLELVAR